jgi:hypothetical protein
MCYLASDLAELLDISTDEVLVVADDCHCRIDTTDDGDFEIVINDMNADRFEYLTGMQVQV